MPSTKGLPMSAGKNKGSSACKSDYQKVEVADRLNMPANKVSKYWDPKEINGND